MADAPLTRFRVFGGEVNGVAAEGKVLQLDPNKFSHAAAQLINRPQHELVPVVVNVVEEFLKFLDCQIPYGLSKSLVLSLGFHI